MKILIRIFFVVWVLGFFVITKIYAQPSIKTIPVSFNQYMRAYPLLNPASSGSFSKIELNTGTQRQAGNWNNINTYYFNANFRLTKDPAPINTEDKEIEERDESDTSEYEAPVIAAAPRNSYHVLGLTLTNDKEGEFINRTGVYGIYAWHTRLTEKLSLSGGASIGFKNYAVGANYVNGGGSAYAPDAGIGVWLYGTNNHIGLSLNQIFNSKLTPIRETTLLIPYYSLTAGKTFDLNRFIALKPSLLIRTANQLPTEVNLCMSALFQELISTSVNYRIQRGFTAMVGFEKLRIGDNYFKAMFAYYVPRGNYRYFNINTYEVSLNYFLKPKSKRYIFL